MIEIGIAQSHSSSACLMRDGEIVGMIQEERFTKRKNQVAFPVHAIRAMVEQHAAGNASAINRLIFAEHHIDPYGVALDRYSEFSVADHIAEQHRLWYPHFYGDGIDVSGYWRDEYLSGRFLNKDHGHELEFIEKMSWDDASAHFSDVERIAAMKRHFGWEGETQTVDHHTCHAYYAFYGTPLSEDRRREALVVTADAWGEGRNWSVWLPSDDGTLRNLGGGIEHSVARLYKFVTLILGMKPNEHEYKVMGMAPYSRSQKHIEATERVFFEILDFRDGDFVSEKPLKDSYFDLKDRLEGHRFDNISAALQNWATQVTGNWISHWLDQTGRKGVCFSGGLSMNIRLNGEVLDRPDVDWLSVPASGGDEALCAGACFAAAADRGDEIQPIRHVYLGGQPVQSEWTDRLGETDMTPGEFGILQLADETEAAKLLAADIIVARCNGPAEFGARSLGNRAILANPANPENVKTINDVIKNRDFWMPFTPSILKEHSQSLLENPKDIDAPYMTIGFRSKPEARKQITGGLHFADYSARPQFVDRETNPEYWALIEAFRALTGIPALLNTSLNLHGEPMNYSVADAARTVALSDLDFLLMPGNSLLFKRRAAGVLEKCLGRSAVAA